jgi:hypothetical protein
VGHAGRSGDAWVDDFEPLRETPLENPQVLDRDGLVAYYASMGWLADRTDGERLPFLNEARSRLGATQYRRRWTTVVRWTTVRGRRSRPA